VARSHGSRRFLAVFASLVACSALAGTALDGMARASAAGPNLAGVQLALTPVATGLSDPVALAWRQGDPRMYVAEKTGTVRIVAVNGTVAPTPVVTVAVAQTDDEQGLLGLTFSPDGTKLYVDYTDLNGDINIVEYTMAGDVADPATSRVLLLIPHPNFPNHNGGEVIFGPDGDLYIGVGDGGSAGDPNGNAQNTDVLLGKILRINPAPSGSLPYTIPADNPFAGQAGKRGEIWMYGLRNPWRFSFDRTTGELWIGDVGQDLYEEVDVAAAGQKGTNFGWNQREGFHAYNGGVKPAGAQDPLFEEPHTNGYCALVGGYVYRGTAIANLNGAYIFGDDCRANLVGVVQSAGVVTAQQDLGPSVSVLSTFGEDPNGELYSASLLGTIYKLVQTAPTISVGDASVLEGDSGYRTVKFPVTLSAAAATAQSVDYTVTGVTATGAAKPGPGVDFKTKSGTLTFTPNGSGKTPVAKTISVSVVGDTTTGEGDETFTVTLSNPQGGYLLGRFSGTGTILNDDGIASGLTFGVGDGAITRTLSGGQKLAFPVTMSAKDLTGTVSANYTITPGSATYSAKPTGGGDFGSNLTGTLSFRPGATAKVVNVSIWPGAGDGSDKTFTITLSGLSGTGVTMIRANGTGTILGQ